MRPKMTAAVLLASATLFFALVMDLRVRVYDEGLILSGAAAVARGWIPHRDFYANYGPANFYLPALFFKLFGPSFLVLRLWDALLRGAIVALCYWTLGQYTRPRIAGTATLIVAFCLMGGDYLSPNVAVLLCACGSAALLLAARDTTAWRSHVLAGMLVGVAAVYRYDAGFFVLVAEIAAMAIWSLRREKDWRQAARQALLSLLAYVGGVAILFLPVAVALVAAGALPGFLNDILDYPLHYYRSMRAIPFPLRPSPELIVYVPFLVPLVVLASFLLPRRPGAPTVRASAADALILFALLAALLLIKGLVRVGSDHMMMAIVASVFALAILAEYLPAWSNPVRAGMALTLCLVALPLLMKLALTGRVSLLYADRTPGGAMLHLGRAAPAPKSADPVFIANPLRATAPSTQGPASHGEFAPEALCATDLVRAKTGPDEPIFVGTMRHDKLFVNMIELYFLADRPAGTHWYHFDPGLQTRADIQAQMTKDLQSRGVRWVIRDSSFDAVQEPNKSAISSGVHLLDTYLAANFRPVTAFGPLSVWARSDVQPGDLSPWQGCVGKINAANGRHGLIGSLLH